MKKVFLLLALAIVFTSCRSGWSCKKRYVETTKIEYKQIKNC